MELSLEESIDLMLEFIGVGVCVTLITNLDKFLPMIDLLERLM